VDLLACSLTATPAGRALVATLEACTNRNFAASSGPTGSPAHGGDRVSHGALRHPLVRAAISVTRCPWSSVST
jgi:hypothetical protein